jgi:hypothetical protein
LLQDPQVAWKELLLDQILDALEPASAAARRLVDVQFFLPGSYAQVIEAKATRDVDVVIWHGRSRAPDRLEDLAEAMTPEAEVPTPAIVLQARRNAEARVSLLREFGALTAAQVAELAGSEARNTSALASRWRREGRVLGVEHHGTTYFPAFQFDEHGRPKPAVADALVHLQVPAASSWQQALWFTTANGWLGGRRPVDVLDEQPAAVVSAAQEAFREPVG